MPRPVFITHFSKNTRCKIIVLHTESERTKIRTICKNSGQFGLGIRNPARNCFETAKQSVASHINLTGFAL